MEPKKRCQERHGPDRLLVEGATVDVDFPESGPPVNFTTLSLVSFAIITSQKLWCLLE